MNIVKLVAVKRLNWDYRPNDYTMGLRWKVETCPNGTIGMSNNIQWCVKYHGFEQIGNIGVGMFYIIDLEHSNVISIIEETDFTGFMKLYKDTLIKQKVRNRIENIDNILDV